MNDQQIQDIADRVIEALGSLAPGETPWWTILASFTPFAAILAAGVAYFIGWRNLKHQQEALAASEKSNARSEWWKRTQWALDATISDDQKMKTYGSSFLKALAQSDLAGPEELALLDTIAAQMTTATDEQDFEMMLADAQKQGYQADVDAKSNSGDTGSSKEEVND